MRRTRKVARIPDLLVVATPNTLGGDACREIGTWGPGETLTVDEPFPLAVSLDELNRS